MTFSASGASVAIPAGSKTIYVDYGNNGFLTIPNNVRVVELAGNYIGVTPNKEYTLTGWEPFAHHSGEAMGDPFLRNVHTSRYWYGASPQDSPDTRGVTFTIFWSTEINAHTPDITDY